MNNADLAGHLTPVNEVETSSTNIGTPCESQMVYRPSNRSNVQVVCRINAHQRQNVAQYNKATGLKRSSGSKFNVVSYHGKGYSARNGAPLRSLSIGLK